jgi:hypothetical protein
MLVWVWVKGKVVSVHTMKAYGEGGVKIQLHTFLSSVIYGSGWSATRLYHFSPGERATGTLNRRLGGPQSGLDCVEKRRNVLHLP